uniref:DUF4283 domain-containing protein n=1 Tax=Oryza brachyantha TaxID=4533 RepID=J3MSF0_ORYBR
MATRVIRGGYLGRIHPRGGMAAHPRPSMEPMKQAHGDQVRGVRPSEAVARGFFPRVEKRGVKLVRFGIAGQGLFSISIDNPNLASEKAPVRETEEDNKNGLSEEELRRLGGIYVVEAEDGEEELLFSIRHHHLKGTLCPLAKSTNFECPIANFAKLKHIFSDLMWEWKVKRPNDKEFLVTFPSKNIRRQLSRPKSFDFECFQIKASIVERIMIEETIDEFVVVWVKVYGIPKIAIDWRTC